MKVNNCLILSAGLGTRMGKIGKVLPKVLWPVFEKTILELQILRAKELGCSKIFINTHFLYDSVSSFLESNKLDDVVLLYEKELLDVGGAIHNVMRQENVMEDEGLLVLSGDQFLFFDDHWFFDLSKKLESSSVILFSINAKSQDSYNEIVVNSDGFLQKIIKSPERSCDYLTYSGVCLINLSQLIPTVGASKFFDSVANFSRGDSVKVVAPQNSEYWDFGTIQRFFKSHFSMLEKICNNDLTSKFIAFCQRHGVFDNNKVNHKEYSYGVSQRKVINIKGGNESLSAPEETLIFKDCKCEKFEGSGIYFKDLYQEL